jgi:hypothetical protein
LFDLRRGYCDYYASTMAVMSRAAGLPARLVVGYASGNYDEAQDRYIVTAANAHSWVEIYFPTYGWVPFEPTAGLPAIERPDEIVSLEPSETDTAAELSDEDSPFRQPGIAWLPSVLGALILALLGAAIWFAGDVWRLHYLSPAAATAIIYRRVYQHARRLGAEVQPGSTPYELAVLFARRVQILETKGALKGISPSGKAPPELAEGIRKRLRAGPTSVSDDIPALMAFYVQAHYSPRSLTPAEQRQAIQIWRRLRWRLWLLRLGKK